MSSPPSYAISSTLKDEKLQVILSVYSSPIDRKLTRLFGKVFTDEELSNDIKNNFKDIHNIHSILQQSSELCKVNIEVGSVILHYDIVFPNGKKFQLEGTLLLQERQLPTENKLEYNEKLQKLQNDVKKLILSAKAGSENTKQLKRMHETIISDIEQLKNSWQEISRWKKQLESRNNQLSNQDSLIAIIDKKIDQCKQFYSGKIQKQAQKIDDIKVLIANLQKKTDKLTQDNTDLRKIVKQLSQEKQNYTTKIQRESEKLEDLKDFVIQDRKKIDKLCQDKMQQNKITKYHQQQLVDVSNKCGQNETKIKVLADVLVNLAKNIHVLTQSVVKQQQSSKTPQLLNVNIIDLQDALQYFTR